MKKHTTFIILLSAVFWIIIFYCNNASAEEYYIPGWIKHNAGWWHDEKINDSEFVQGIQYLINQGIIKIPQTTPGPHLSQQLPMWVKTIAGAWSDNRLSDEDFGKGLRYLVGQGIIKISSPQLPSEFVKVDQKQFVVSYGKSVQVNIYGKVNDPKGGKVVLTIIKPDGIIDKIQNYVTNTGDFSSPIILDEYSLIGQYQIIASYQSINFGSVSFNFVPESALTNTINPPTSTPPFNTENTNSNGVINPGTSNNSGATTVQTLSELSGNVEILTNSSEHVFSFTNSGIVISENQALNKALNSPYIVESKEGSGIVLTMPSFTSEKISLDTQKNPTGLKITQIGSKIVNYRIFSDKINTYAWNSIKNSIDFADKNSTSVINQAFDALSNGGVVLINAGTYTMSGTILLNSNDVLEGNGWSTILKMANGANIDMIKEKKPGRENIVIRNLQIDGNRVNQDKSTHTHGIYISEASNVIIDHVLVNHIDGTGITFAIANQVRYNHALINSVVNDTASDAVYFVGNRGIVANNTLTNWNDTGLVPAYCRDCIISNNQISGIPTAIGNGIAIISNSTRLAVLDNVIKNSPHEGIIFQKVGFAYAVNKILISGNHILNNFQNGINMGSIADKNYGVIINNNEIANNTEHGIIITGNKTILTNNLIEKNGRNGVFLYNAHNTLISGNIISDNGLISNYHDNYGIEISGDPPHGTDSTLITGNYIFDDQFYKTQKDPINTESTSDNAIMTGNWFHGIIPIK